MAAEGLTAVLPIARCDRAFHSRETPPLPKAAANAPATWALEKTLIWMPQFPSIQRLKRRKTVSYDGASCPKKTTRGGCEGQNGNCA